MRERLILVAAVLFIAIIIVLVLKVELFLMKTKVDHLKHKAARIRRA